MVCASLIAIPFGNLVCAEVGYGEELRLNLQVLVAASLGYRPYIHGKAFTLSWISVQVEEIHCSFGLAELILLSV